jgi:predicted permease
MMPSLFHDIRLGWRQMRRAPVTALAAVLTVALGIGANAAVLNVAWPVLVAPLPFPDEDRLTVTMLRVERGGAPRTNALSPGDYVDLSAARAFASVAAFDIHTTNRTLTGLDEPRQLSVGSVTGGFFQVLGVTPVAGRGLDDSDQQPGARPIVLHERVWRRYFGADPSVIDRAIRIDGVSWTVVGVMPAAAGLGTLDVDAWTITRVDPVTARQILSYGLAMLGRLRPDISLDAANAELIGIMVRAADQYPATNTGLSARAESFRERLTGPVRPVLLLLIGGATLVLLVAGINLGGLQVARNIARQPELAVRSALGAGRRRLVRQLTTESLVVAVAGGLVGLVAAVFTLSALAQLAPRVGWHDVSSDLTRPVFWLAGGLALVTGVLAGWVPALAATRSTRAVPHTRGGTASRAVGRVRVAIVATQVALTVLLLVAATLGGGSLVRLLNVDPGFRLEQGLVADVQANRPTAGRFEFFDTLVTRAAALPGVERACAMSDVPLDTDGSWMTWVPAGGTDRERVQAVPLSVTDGCFDTLQIRLRDGRAFTRVEGEPVAIVSESVAAALWPDGRAIDQQMHIGLATGPLVRVVGVAHDVRAGTLETRGLGQVWLPAATAWPAPQRLVLRTMVLPESLVRPLRAVLAEMDPDLALANVRTMHDIVGRGTASRRFVMVLLGSFSMIAIALCAVGVYGMLTHLVGQRTREIGIRVALGAHRGHVVGSLTRPVGVGVAGGVLVGLIAAWMLSSVLATLLFELSPTDSRVYAAVAGFVVIVATLAALPSIRRALKVSPVAALQQD